MGKGSKGCDQREMKDGGFMGIPDLHPYEECTRLKSGFRGQCGEGDVKYCSLRGKKTIKVRIQTMEGNRSLRLNQQHYACNQ